MNFETGQPFDRLLGRLLAMIIMGEKQIQEIRKKLVGNQEFHTRLIFQKLDGRKKGQVSPEDIQLLLSSAKLNVSIFACRLFCRKYTVTGCLTYEELLSILMPKTNKSLSQRLLIRTVKRGISLPNYLWTNFLQLLGYLIKLLQRSQQIRQKIHLCQQLNHLQMVQFFRKILKSKTSILNFCNSTTESDQYYDFSANDVDYLSFNILSGNDVREFTDEDIKELICPMDMNYQKTVHEMTDFYNKIKLDKQKTLYTGFNQKSHNAENTANFLNTKYNPKYTTTKFYKTYEVAQNGRQNPINFNINESQKDTSHLYLDRFIAPNNEILSGKNYQYQGNNVLELDRFLTKGHEVFKDQMPNLSSSSSNSAFAQY